MGGFFSSLLSFAGGIPWAKVGLFAALAGAVLAVIHGLKDYGEQTQLIAQLQASAKSQHEQDQKTIADLQEEYQKGLQAIEKEKTDAIQIAKDSQSQLDQIKTTKPTDDGDTRPVLIDTLGWMRDHRSGDGNKNPEGSSAHGVALPSPAATGP